MNGNLGFYLTLAAAVMSALSLVLHAVGVKSPKAEAMAEDVDKVRAAMPAQGPTPSAAPAAPVAPPK